MSKQQRTSIRRFPRILGKVSVSLLMAVSALTSCSKMDQYFEEPSWLRGSIFETLQEDGKYSKFLECAEKAGFKPILSGSAICTVMAPDDDQMNIYLQSNFNTTDTSLISVEELQKLIGFHILYYSYDTNMLTNFRPEEGDGADMSSEDVLKTMGIYFKFRTRSQDPISIERGITDAGDSSTVNVYHLDRFIPVFNKNLFQTKQISDPTYNYNYFYPETSSQGILDGNFTVSNAAVTDYAVKTSNGYIYRIDRVLKPLETLYNEIKKRPEYSIYLSLYDKNKVYTYNQTLTNSYGNGTNLYQILHGSQAPIALEWPVTDYKDLVNLSSKCYSLFPFTNQSIQDFFNDYWLPGGYSSINDSELEDNMGILLSNSYYSNGIAFPEEIKNNKITNTTLNNDTINFPVDEIPQANRVMCCNGVLYGCTTLTPPKLFGSITGPAYQSKKYSVLLKMMKIGDNTENESTPSKGGLIATLGTSTAKYIMLVPNDDVISQPCGTIYKGIRLESVDNGTTAKKTTKLWDNSSADGSFDWDVGKAVKISVSKNLEGTNISTDLSSMADGTVIRTFSDDRRYWYIKRDAEGVKITNCIKFADMLYYKANPIYNAGRDKPNADFIWSRVKKLYYRGNQEWSNGTCWEYDKSLFVDNGIYNNGSYNSLYEAYDANKGDNTTDFYGWFKLLNIMGLQTSEELNYLKTDGGSYMMFIPTTLELAKAIAAGKIPYVKVPEGTTVTSLADVDNVFNNITPLASNSPQLIALRKYLRSYYVPMSSANVADYPYLGWGEHTDNALITADNEDSDSQGNQITTNMNIYDTGSKLYITRVMQKQNAQGKYYFEELPTKVNVTSEYGYLPIVFNEECVHFLDGVLPLDSDGN